MLQQAFVVALFPEHEVQVFDKVPAAGTLAAVDLLIIDAPALRGGDALSTREVRAIQSCRMPVVWIDTDAPPDTAAFTRLVRLSPPLKRDELRAAAAACLGSTAELTAVSKPARTVAAKTKTTEPTPQRAAPDNAKEFIDLVDVFEETPQRDEINAEARNKN
jgi:hypothetical protein